MRARELEVALVVSRNGHDRPRAVRREDEARGVDRQARAGERVAAVGADEDAVLADGAFRGRLRTDALHELRDRGFLGGAGGQSGNQRMLDREADERRAEDGVGAGGEDGDPAFAVGERKRQLGTDALADPVPLHGQDLLRPADEGVAADEQLLGIGGDAEKPLLELPLLDHRLAAPAAPVLDLLVREYGLAARAPVDERLPPIGEAALEHRQEELLLPAIVLGIARGDLAPPVVAEPHPSQLAAHVVDVVARPNRRMDAALDRGVLRR